MNSISISRFFLKLYAYQPFWLIRLHAAFLYLLMRYVIRYRAGVVSGNLRKAFPDKSDSEIKRIQGRFYKQFSEFIAEMLKMPSLSRESIKKRYRLTNPELAEQMHRRGKSIIMVMAHYANWEWSANLPIVTPYKVLAAYKPLKSKAMDAHMKYLRSLWGVEPTPMKLIFKKILLSKTKGEPLMVLMVSDQTPHKGDIEHYADFLGRKTPVFLGPEKIAQKADMAVMFFKVKKLKAGRYEITLVPVADDAKELPQHEITQRHLAELEKHIREAPEYWLWSHRRWKYAP